MKSGLYLVALPIGNLGDMSFRAVATLKACDQIWAEDTRNIRKLLTHFDIEKSPRDLFACHDHNEREMSERLVTAIQDGVSVAYVSDAGMPVVSDPGYRLVKAVQDAGQYVTVVPGPSAVLSALALSGLPSDRFAFYGFIPNKDGKRGQFFEDIRSSQMTIVAFESPRRVESALEKALNVMGSDAQIAIVREITKTFEEVIRGSIAEVLERLRENPIKGEVVIVFAPVVRVEMDDDDVKDALREALTSMRMKEAVRMVTERHDLQRNRVYDLALEIVNHE